MPKKRGLARALRMPTMLRRIIAAAIHRIASPTIGALAAVGVLGVFGSSSLPVSGASNSADPLVCPPGYALPPDYAPPSTPSGDPVLCLSVDGSGPPVAAQPAPGQDQTFTDAPAPPPLPTARQHLEQAARMGYEVISRGSAAVDYFDTHGYRYLAVTAAGTHAWKQYKPSSRRACGVVANADDRKVEYTPADAILTAAL